MDILSTYSMTLIVLAAVFGFLMAWGIGANDVANAMGTSVGSKALTIKQAILVAMVFEFAGAYLAGGEVTATIRSGIIDQSYVVDRPDLFVLGMISALLAAGIWLVIASYLGWPVSTTHSIIGAIVGFAAVGIAVESVYWSKVGSIVGSWVITPLIAGVIAYFIFMSAQRLIFDDPDPLKAAKKYVPFYMGLGGFIMSLMTIKKGLTHVGLDLGELEGYLWAVGIAVLLVFIGFWVINRIKFDAGADRRMQFNNVERVFAVLMVVTACCMAFAHGSNDVANAIGPVAAVVSTVTSGGDFQSQAQLAWWVLPLGAFGIVMGLALF